MNSPGPSVTWPPGTSPWQLQPGQVQEIRSVPLWAAPDWQDEGEERQKSFFPVRKGFLDTMRPAMRPSDDAQNPTEHARRFGIFPGRTDGRSRTSPTRSPSRQVPFPNGEVKSGQEVFDHFEELAREWNQDLDEMMVEGMPHLRRMDLEEQAFMDAYEDLTIDEFWQGLLFGEFTMDELKAGGHFPMGPVPSNLHGLQGPLHPFLQRSRWSQDAHGYGTKWPGMLYTHDNGSQATIDPGSDDFLWNAMQPALQLATRLLEAKEPYFDALQDIRKWCYVEPHMDRRHEQDKQWRQLVKFCRDPPYDKTIVGSLGLIPSASLDPVAMCWRVLERDIVMRLGSGNYLDIGYYEYTLINTQGLAWIPEHARPHKPIIISMGFETVMPLLTNRYSESEKMMASYVLGITITHEFMHAYEYAPYKWARYPEAYGITDPVDIEFCRRFSTAVWGPAHPDPALDAGHFNLRFEDATNAEAGHLYETHVLGGGTWPMSGAANRFIPEFLKVFSGIGARVKWPTIVLEEERDITYPRISPGAVIMYVKIQEIHMLFTEEFWRVSVEKYGMAALRDASNTMSKVFYQTEDLQDLRDLYRLALLKDLPWKELYDLMMELASGEHRVMLHYIRMLVLDNCLFELMLFKFINDVQAWEVRDETLERNLAHTMMIACEASTLFYEQQQDIDASDRRNFQTSEFDAWRELQRYAGGNPDLTSPQGAVGLDEFIAAVSGPSPSLDERITRPLTDLCCDLQEEQFRQEAQIAELYSFPAGYWPHYINGVPGHRDLWVARAKRYSTDVRRVMNKMTFISQYIPSWHQHWEPKLIGYALAFDNIAMLVQQDSTEVHSNWRELLRSIPMLRASRRKPYERFYFLAKKEMMKLKGHQLYLVREFISAFSDFLNVDNSKLSLPSDETAFMTRRWAGLLEDSLAPVGRRTTWMDMVRCLDENDAGSGIGFIQARVQLREQQRDSLLRRAERASQLYGSMVEGLEEPLFQDRFSLRARSRSSNRDDRSDRRRSASPATEQAGEDRQDHGRQKDATNDDRRRTRRSRRRRHRRRRGKRAQVDEPDSDGDMPMLDLHIIEARLSNNSVPLSQPQTSTASGSSQERGLGWREVAAITNQPFGDGPVASGSTRANLVPHSYTISDTAIDDLYAAVTQKLQQQSIQETVPPGEEDPRTARDEEALRAMQEAIREGRAAQTQALENALSYLPAAQKLASEAASKAQKQDKGKGVEQGSSSAAGDRGRRRTRAEDTQATGARRGRGKETEPGVVRCKVIYGCADDFLPE